MPNWCSNVIYLKHEDHAQLERAENALKRGEFMNEFLPIPEGADWYTWHVENWGTKWDVESESIFYQGEILVATYDSAWAPPIGFYHYLLKLGFVVRALYYEPDQIFCGIFDNGDDEHYNLDDLNIPTELKEEFGIK